MAKRRGAKQAAGRANTPRRRAGNGGNARAQNSTGVRTVNVSVVSSTIVPATSGVVWDLYIQGSAFPGLKAHLDHAIEWRIRSARITFNSVVSTSGYSVAALLAPYGATWKPADWVAMETSGGVIKPVKNSGWSTNNLGAQDNWVNHANPAGTFYICGVGGPDPKTEVGTVTLNATIQLRGNR